MPQETSSTVGRAKKRGATGHVQVNDSKKTRDEEESNLSDFFTTSNISSEVETLINAQPSCSKKEEPIQDKLLVETCIKQYVQAFKSAIEPDDDVKKNYYEQCVSKSASSVNKKLNDFKNSHNALWVDMWQTAWKDFKVTLLIEESSESLKIEGGSGSKRSKTTDGKAQKTLKDRKPVNSEVKSSAQTENYQEMYAELLLKYESLYKVNKELLSVWNKTHEDVTKISKTLDIKSSAQETKPSRVGPGADTL